MENFEIILLKNLLSNKTFFNKVFPILEKKFFIEENTKGVFSLIKDYYKDYSEVPSLIEVITKVKNVSSAETRKNLASAIKAISDCETISNLDFLCDETLKFAKDALYLEALTLGAEGLQNKSDSLKLKAQEVLDKRAKLSINDEIGLDYDDMDKMIEYFSKRDIGVLTQHKQLNKRLGSGFLPGTLSVILAGQSVGKSLLMCDLISGMLLNKKNVLLVSLEMADYEMMKRIYANTLDLNVNSFSDLSKTEGELAQLDREITTKSIIEQKYNQVKMSGNVGKFFVKDFPTGSFSALQLQSLVEKFQNEKDIKFDCIFIDYLGIMKSDLLSPSAGLYSYVKSIGEEVRAVAKKLNVAIVSASQLNRCIDVNSLVQTKGDKVKLKDLRVGDYVKSHDGFRKVLGKSNVEVKKTYKIKTKKGKEIIISAEHRIPTNNGLKTINFGLKVGDLINSI